MVVDTRAELAIDRAAPHPDFAQLAGEGARVHAKFGCKHLRGDARGVSPQDAEHYVDGNTHRNTKNAMIHQKAMITSMMPMLFQFGTLRTRRWRM
jgi:hypothetical protein